jgi:hypothetical protein
MTEGIAGTGGDAAKPAMKQLVSSVDQISSK